MNANYGNNTIEMTAKEAKAAGKIGTKEFKNLQTLRRMNPTFEIVIVKASKGKKKDSMRGLTYEYMEKYIKAHDDEQGSIMKAYENLRATSDEAKEACADAASYGEIKKWFLSKYPAIADFHKKREELLAV